MARLPIPGQDVLWGDILNNFLLVEHNPDGTLRLADTIQSRYAKPIAGIPKTDLSEDIQKTLTKVDDLAEEVTTLSSTDIPVITKDDVGLSNVTNDAQLKITSNLSDLSDVNVARTNLGLGTANAPRFAGMSLTDAVAATNATPTSAVLALKGAPSQTGSYFIIRDSNNSTVLDLDANGQFNSRNFVPRNNNAWTLGDSTHFWSAVYATNIVMANNSSISLGTGTGTRIGTATNQKLSFFNAIPVVQQPGGAYVATASYGLNEQAMLNNVWTALRNLGLIN